MAGTRDPSGSRPSSRAPLAGGRAPISDGPRPRLRHPAAEALSDQPDRDHESEHGHHDRDADPRSGLQASPAERHLLDVRERVRLIGIRPITLGSSTDITGHGAIHCQLASPTGPGTSKVMAASWPSGSTKLDGLTGIRGRRIVQAKHQEPRSVRRPHGERRTGLARSHQNGQAGAAGSDRGVRCGRAAGLDAECDPRTVRGPARTEFIGQSHGQRRCHAIRAEDPDVLRLAMRPGVAVIGDPGPIRRPAEERAARREDLVGGLIARCGSCR